MEQTHHIDAFQDSLYTHSNRRFYRECNIYGTVDFIFGNSTVVIQSCKYTTQETIDGPEKHDHSTRQVCSTNQNTGSYSKTALLGHIAGLVTHVQTLGPPWKNYQLPSYC
ncbi:putative pectinesterase/pectinesterase inhibitor 46 [Artemisia annua]|uniref:Pectinesterase n=1 Tax=Artemisia annua TaxID=35608 RepID=A0A2U1KL78_ARTAN|nr:putative pectinesterase/pectinesterase inhibitor 46 [Artemisia annua]